nr:DUF2235 domain-containing protein [Rhodoferax sp.]
MDSIPRGRQLVICCDGTNNNLTGNTNDTNVVKLAQLLAQSSPADASQMVFYDPGVGNPGELPGATWADGISRWAQRVAGLAFGRGVYENMADCYLFLMRHYQPGDQIYIFGFSRGAFTARSVAGLVNQFGVLRPHMESMLPTLIHTYFSDRELKKEKIAAIANQASGLFANAASRVVEIQFVGVWDTVASVGMGPFSAKITALPTIKGKHFLNVRHALALDEQRAQFKPRLYVDDNGTYETSTKKPATIKQVWFRGAHCDVGGGFVWGQTGISDRALCWLVSEAVQCGLALQYNGVSLDSETAVAASFANTVKADATPPVHSQFYTSPLWALTGMAVRDTQKVDLDSGESYAVQPVEHASVTAHEYHFPQNTVWSKPRSMRNLAMGVVATLLFMLAHGEALNANPFAWSPDWQALGARLGDDFAQNAAFARWQLQWWQGDNLRSMNSHFGSPLWALVWDTGLIAAYAYVLAWFAVAAFARHVGLRRVAQTPAPWLNPLGWALPAAVGSDLLENLASLLVVWCQSRGDSVWATLLACPMTLFSLAKWVSLLGVLLLIALPARRPSRR